MLVGYMVWYYDGGLLFVIGLFVIFIKFFLFYIVCLIGEVGLYNIIFMLMKYCINVVYCVNSCYGGFFLMGFEVGRCLVCICISVLRVFLISYCVFFLCFLYYFNILWWLVFIFVDKVFVNLYNEILK